MKILRICPEDLSWVRWCSFHNLSPNAYLELYNSFVDENYNPTDGRNKTFYRFCIPNDPLKQVYTAHSCFFKLCNEIRDKPLEDFG